MLKLKLIVPVVLLVVLGAVYELVLAKPAVKPKIKIAGAPYVMPKAFLINLKDGHFATLSTALIFKEGYTMPAAGAEAATPPDGYGALPEESVIRGIITSDVTGGTSAQLISRPLREQLQKEIAADINKQTDVKVAQVVFTDAAVQ